MIMRMIRVIDTKNYNEVVLELPYSEWRGILTCLSTEDQERVQREDVELSKVDMLMFLEYLRDKAEVFKMYEVAMMLYWTASSKEYHTYNIKIDEVKR